jgi:hypothetical protein
MHSRHVLFGAALALLLLCPLAARADPIGFEYNFQTPAAVTGDDGNLGVVSFSTTNSGQASGTATVTAAKIAAVTAASGSNPDTFSGETYTLTLQLNDDPSGKAGSLTFNGRLFGSLTATAANITTSFSSATQQLVLGNDLYTVSVGPLVPPTTPNPTVVGTLFATVSAQPNDVSTPALAPEPTGLVLAGLGVTGILVARRMRRQEMPAPQS